MNAQRTSSRLISVAATLGILSITQSTLAQVPAPIRAGQNGTGPGHHLDVPFDSQNMHWVIGQDPIPLIADPSAPPMDKWFHSPRDVTGAPILLDALQPLPFPVWENFLVWPGAPGAPGPSPAITDWHEHIHEPGWVWQIPDPSQQSLITQNGQPWPWSPIPNPNPDPAWLWVEFPPITPGNVLDIHKELLWVGTPDNRIWGDGILDNGTDYDETMIAVWEYPTIPEPSTIVLGVLLSLGVAGVRIRR